MVLSKDFGRVGQIFLHYRRTTVLLMVRRSGRIKIIILLFIASFYKLLKWGLRQLELPGKVIFTTGLSWILSF